MPTDPNKIHVKLYDISHQCSLCGYHMGRISESVCEIFDYSVADSEESDTEHSILLCKECSARRRKRNIRGYVDLRFAELSLELAIITELRRELSSSRHPVRALPKPDQADLEELVADWDNA
jgi:5-methylcytosine-specific restriction endonuclease McrA